MAISTRKRAFGHLNIAATLSAMTTFAILLSACGTTGTDVPLSTPGIDTLPNCNCYFASDCQKWFGDKTVCDRNEGNGGSGGKETECRFMKPKPDKAANKKGCSESNDGQPSRCDGHCVKPDNGSFCGDEDRSAVAAAVELWSEAFIEPARTGGGRVNPSLVAETGHLALSKLCNGQIARSVLSLVELAWSDILLHPNAPHKEEDHRLPDLSGDFCRIHAANTTARALATTVRQPGLMPRIADEIREACPGTLPFANPCRGQDAIACVEASIGDMATYLTTPKQPAERIIRTVLIGTE